MTEIPSTKEITFGNLLSALSNNEIPNLGNLFRSANKIISINKTPFKLTGNKSSQEY